MRLPFKIKKNRFSAGLVGVSLLLLLIVWWRSGNESTPNDSLPQVLAPKSQESVQAEVAAISTVAKNSAEALPQVKSLRVTPLPAFPGSLLKAEAENTDTQGNRFDFEYEWRRNDEVLAGETGQELDTTGFRKGDLIVVTVTPSLGKVRGEPRSSLQQLMHNRPPTIVSTPSGGITAGKFSYQLHAEDPDSDHLTYSLNNASDGMAIDAETGLLEWLVPDAANGKKLIQIVVTDGDASAFQSFELTVTSKPTDGELDGRKK